MHTTPVSLLERLRQPAEEQSWARFVNLYTPLIYYWARRTGLQPEDASDLVQEVFAVLVEKLPEFVYDRTRSFRGWLRTITLNKWRERRRRLALLPMDNGADALANLAGPDGVDGFGDAEYRQHLVGRALELMRTDFQPTTWQACWEHVVSGKSAVEVARQLGITVDAVYAAKYRVLSRLRQELDGLLD